MPKVLVITYYWPPGAGAGVQRWLKFSKYLPSFGWEPVIITVDPDLATYPATDPGLAEDVPPSLRVIRTKVTDYFRIYNKDRSKIPSAGFASGESNSLRSKLLRFIRGNFFIPDPRKGWNRYAFYEARRIIEEEGISHVITTSPPHSTQLIGLKLKRKFPGILWIADLRDPWTDIYYYDQFYHTGLARKADLRYEKSVLRNADRIITVGNSLKELFSSKLPGIHDKIHVVTNGYDNDDFEHVVPSLPEIFTISYIGTLSDDYPIEGFLRAVRRLLDNGFLIKTRFIGIMSARQHDIILSALGAEAVEFIPYVSHKDAIRFMSDSSALLLVIPLHSSNRSILTGKLFEYLASKKPILCIGPPDGDAAGIIRDSGSGQTIDYSGNEIIEEYLRSLITGQEPFITDIAEYSRENLTRQLANQLEK